MITTTRREVKNYKSKPIANPAGRGQRAASWLALGASSLHDVDAAHPALSVEASLSSTAHGAMSACPASCLDMAVRIRHGEDCGGPDGAAGCCSSRRLGRASRGCELSGRERGLLRRRLLLVLVVVHGEGERGRPQRLRPWTSWSAPPPGRDLWLRLLLEAAAAADRGRM